MLDEGNLAIRSFNQGVENSNLQHFDKAITDYTRAIELDPKLAVAYINRRFAYWKLDQNDEAIADVTVHTPALPETQELANIKNKLEK